MKHQDIVDLVQLSSKYGQIGKICLDDNNVVIDFDYWIAHDDGFFENEAKTLELKITRNNEVVFAMRALVDVVWDSLARVDLR